MSSIPTGKWFWIIVVSVVLVVSLPLLIIWAILYLPPEGKIAATVLIIVGWGLVAGYREWVTNKRKQESQRLP